MKIQGEQITAAVDRILRADCAATEIERRSRRIANCFYVAGTCGLAAGIAQLEQLAREAESGAFSGSQEDERPGARAGKNGLKLLERGRL